MTASQCFVFSPKFGSKYAEHLEKDNDNDNDSDDVKDVSVHNRTGGYQGNTALTTPFFDVTAAVR